MSITDEFDFTGIDDDILLAGADAYAPREAGSFGGGDSFWSMKANTSKTMYFHTDPWFADADGTVAFGSPDGVWFNYRAIYAEAGLAGGIELPGGLREFAVKDQTTITLADGTRQRQDIRLSSPDADPLLQLVNPYLPRMSKASSPFRPVSDKGAVNIVEIGEKGEEYPKILVLTGNRMKKLKTKLKEYYDMVDGFTCVGKQWVLTISGQGITEELELRWVKGAPPIEMPEPYDIRVLLQNQRARILDIVESATGVDVAAVHEAEAVAAHEADFDPLDMDAPSAPETETYPMVDKAELYASYTDARLKTLLAKKGVKIPAKSAREDLLRLALDNDV